MRALGTVEGSFVDTGTERIHVRRFGEGPPLLFVHGFPLSGLTHADLVEIADAALPPHEEQPDAVIDAILPWLLDAPAALGGRP